MWSNSGVHWTGAQLPNTVPERHATAPARQSRTVPSTKRSRRLPAVRPSRESRRPPAPSTDHDVRAIGVSASGISTDIEHAWVARSRADDVEAFEAIFRRYYEQLCLYAEGRLQSPDMARDAVQDVFVAIWKHKDSCRGCDSLRAYLFTAARNRVLKLLRHRNVVSRTRTRMTLEQRSPGHGAAPDTPEELIGAKELAAAVERIIRKLPERSREAYLLHRRDGLSYAEIAAVMGVSERTVENHIARALRGFRDGLSDWIS